MRRKSSVGMTVSATEMLLDSLNKDHIPKPNGGKLAMRADKGLGIKEKIPAYSAIFTNTMAGEKWNEERSFWI